MLNYSKRTVPPNPPDDPCERLAAEIAKLKAERKLAQEDLKSAHGSMKKFLTNKIRQLTTLIEQKEKRLKNCNPVAGTTALTQEVAAIILPGTDGDIGFYLKQVGGPILASFHINKIFEPASTIKVILHFHAMLQVQAKPNLVNAQVPWFMNYESDSAGNPTSCPVDTGPQISVLTVVLSQMMQNSDNRATQAIRTYFGGQNINDTANLVAGMLNTSYNHRDGCAGGPDGAIANPNKLTLFDAGLLYEGIANGNLLLPGIRTIFYSLMPGKNYDSSGLWQDIIKIVDLESPASMTAVKKQSFLNAANAAYKAGGYTISGKIYRSIAGWVQVPFHSPPTVPGGIIYRDYVFGLDIDKASNADNADAAASAARLVLLRDIFGASLKTW